MNHRLIHAKPLTATQTKMHEAIKKLAKASGHEFHVFSGTSKDFGALAKHSKDGIFHSPAHISATHDGDVALSYADSKKKVGVGQRRHVMHVHVKPHDRVLHISNHSENSGEHETIIPAGTKLKYSHTSIHKPRGRSNRTYRVHHFTIHSQE